MITNYYFLASLLPELQIGVPPEINYQQLLFLLGLNLSQTDAEKVAAIRRYYDIQNMRSLWRNEPLSFRGNCDEVELEEALVTESGLPNYVFEFMQLYDTTEERLSHFTFLLAAYYKQEAANASGFLFYYLVFQRDLRLVLTALRSKKMGRDLLVELQYEDPDDDNVAQILAQKDAPYYEPPENFAELKQLFDAHSEAPLELHKALIEYQFQKIDELLGVDFFTINCILAYMIKLNFVEKWLELDKKRDVI